MPVAIAAYVVLPSAGQAIFGTRQGFGRGIAECIDLCKLPLELGGVSGGRLAEPLPADVGRRFTPLGSLAHRQGHTRRSCVLAGRNQRHHAIGHKAAAQRCQKGLGARIVLGSCDHDLDRSV